MSSKRLKGHLPEAKTKHIYVCTIQLKMSQIDYPMVVIKLVVKEPSEKRKRRQLLPTPAKRSREADQRNIGLWVLQKLRESRNNNHFQLRLQQVFIKLGTVRSTRTQKSEHDGCRTLALTGYISRRYPCLGIQIMPSSNLNAVFQPRIQNVLLHRISITSIEEKRNTLLANNNHNKRFGSHNLLKSSSPLYGTKQTILPFIIKLHSTPSQPGATATIL